MLVQIIQVTVLSSRSIYIQSNSRSHQYLQRRDKKISPYFRSTWLFSVSMSISKPPVYKNWGIQGGSWDWYQPSGHYLQVKTIDKECVRPKTFHHGPSPRKQENVQIEALSPCNYPICFRSASRSSRGPNRRILFAHSFIEVLSIQTKFINCVFAKFPGAGFEDLLTWVYSRNPRRDPTLLNRIVMWSWISGWGNWQSPTQFQC